MIEIEQWAWPRAGLLGNPSDGYFGKTIAFTFRDFGARVTLGESEGICLVPDAAGDGLEFANAADFRRRFAGRDFGGGVRLLQAAIKRFWDYCDEAGHALPRRGFTLRYETNIPRQVGLAGSSAIITAAMKVLSAYYDITIPPAILANLILEAETRELGIPAGLQDRVVQTFEGLVFMDFAESLMRRQGHGRYERMDAALLQNVYIAWDERAAEGTELPHGRLRERWEAGDAEVRRSLDEIAALVDPGRQALEAGDRRWLGELINHNFDLRARILPIHTAHRRMIDTARAAGASAKFAGSGGAIVGLYGDDVMLECLRVALVGIGCKIIRPTTA